MTHRGQPGEHYLTQAALETAEDAVRSRIWMRIRTGIEAQRRRHRRRQLIALCSASVMTAGATAALLAAHLW